MLWLVLTIILGLVFIGALIARSSARSTEARRTSVMLMFAVPVTWFLLSLFLSLHTVGQREVGVVSNFSGTISGSKNPGVVVTWPWQSVQKQNVGLQREDFELDSSNTAVSQDLQPIFARITLNYQVEPRQVVRLYKQVGPTWKTTLLDSRVLQDFKEVTSQFPASDITTRRPELRRLTKQRLVDELAPYDIRVVDFFVKNIDYSDSYSRAIDAKNRQVQEALRAKAKVAQARYEGEQQLAQAQSQAKANRLLARSITPSLVRLRAIEKLNPNVQVMYVPAGASLFLPQASASEKSTLR